MTMANGLLPTSRPRCPAHGLLLDDAARCSRCLRESDDRGAHKSALAWLVGITLLVVGAFALYRLGTAGYEAIASAREPRVGSTTTTSATPEGNARLVVYTTGSCGACRFAKKWMDEHAVEYEERRVDTDASAHKELVSLGKGMTVPTFVVGGDEVLVGFDVQGARLTKALEKHANKR
jgi:glutaredoxin